MFAVLALLPPGIGAAQHGDPERARQVYERACAACHGPDGRGRPADIVALEVPLPDFTDCAFATVEPDVDWLAVSHLGGPARAFDRAMPAFAEALSDEEIQLAVNHVRTFCTNPAWPRGELNLPRPLVTEKAFPENEAVLTTSVALRGEGAVGNEFLYEQRLGPRSQFEIVVPIDAVERPGGGWAHGLGDVAVAFKHAFHHSLRSGTIVSAAGEVIFPSGSDDRGLGSGTTIFEPFVAVGQLLPADGFVQVQAGFELPADREKAGREAFWRAAIGKTFTEGRFGRAWSPAVEFLAAKELDGDEPVVWDLVPQVQVSLSTRQHILLSTGVRFPLNEREGRTTALITYFLWDWFDGGLFSGW